MKSPRELQYPICQGYASNVPGPCLTPLLHVVNATKPENPAGAMRKTHIIGLV